MVSDKNRRFPFIDTACADLITGGCSIWFWCVCGHKVNFRSSEFGRWPTSSLHKVAAKLKCSKCGKVGAIDGVISAPEHTGPAWARK